MTTLSDFIPEISTPRLVQLVWIGAGIALIGWGLVSLIVPILLAAVYVVIGLIVLLRTSSYARSAAYALKRRYPDSLGQPLDVLLPAILPADVLASGELSTLPASTLPTNTSAAPRA